MQGSRCQPLHRRHEAASESVAEGTHVEYATARAPSESASVAMRRSRWAAPTTVSRAPRIQGNRARGGDYGLYSCEYNDFFQVDRALRGGPLRIALPRMSPE